MGAPAGFITVTAEENAVDSVERAVEFMQRIDLESRVKWTVIALHHSLYCFLICAIQGSTRRRVMTKNRRLIDFREALKRAQSDEWMGQYVSSKKLELSEDEKTAINLIWNELRNEFEHFSPNVWGIYTEGFSDAVKHVLRVIRFLALECGNVVLLSQERHASVRPLRGLRPPPNKL